MSKWNPVHIGGAIIIGAGVGALLYALVMGDGHEPAPYEPSGVRVLSVCPSASWALEEVGEAAMWWADIGYPLVSVRLDVCDGPPLDAELQLRADGDAVEGWEAYLRADQLDLVGVRGGRGVAYLDRYNRRPCTIRHAVGHGLGVGHTTAASSVMHPVCGSTASGVGR